MILWSILIAAALRSQRISAAIFVLCGAAHQCLYGPGSGAGYYVAAAAFDALAVVLLMPRVARCRAAARLQTLSMFSIVGNIAGWRWYEGYHDMAPYDTAFLVLYAAAILIMIGGRGVGGDAEFHFNYRRSSHRVWEKSV